MKWAELRKILAQKLTRLSATICHDCIKKHGCVDESKCEKHKLLNEILEAIE